MNTDEGKVLIVDDQGVNRMLLTHYLEEHGFEPVAVGTAEEAQERVQSEGFDILLLDVVMPGMSGLDLLKWLRERYTLTELPVIMATAKNESADIVTALELGANDYVTKPVDVPVAVARLRTHLRLRRMDRQLRESEERYALAVRGANEGLWDWDLVQDEVYYSPRWKLLLGFEEEEVGTSPSEWMSRLHPEDRQRVEGEIQEHLAGTVPHFESQHRLLHADGTYRWMLVRGLAIKGEDGQAYRMAGSLSDITASRMYDNATGLPNRTLLLDRVERALARAGRRDDLLFAVMALSLDQFELLQSSLGQGDTERILATVGRRLQLLTRTSDTVARLDGAVFAMLLDEIRHISDATRVAGRVAQTLHEPIFLEDKELRLTASLGIALSATGYERPEHVLRDATTAMMQARAMGGARHEMFDREMHREAELRIRLETELRQAVERQEFLVHYQPIVNLTTGRTESFEALVRWRHPERGMVSPAEFIPICEQTGLVVPMGSWVLKEAAAQTKRWLDQDPSLANGLTISVNLSGRQLAEPNLVDTVARALGDAGLEPSRVKLEITESVLMQHYESAVEKMHALREMGIRLSIDDFGTGYSSLSHLHRFPIDYLKVDRSFVWRLGPDLREWEIVRVIVTLARNLGMRTIAEGIETQDQASVLESLGCDYGQGYLYARPLDAEAATRFLFDSPVPSA